MTAEFRDYVDAVTDDRRKVILHLHATILRLYPEAEQKISYRILMHRMQPGWVGLGYWKGGVTLYSEAIPMIAEFKRKHPAIKTGKGCINFKASDVLPQQDLEQVIRFAMEPGKHPAVLTAEV